MSQLADLSLETRGDVQLARIEGEVDLSNATEIGDRVLEATSNDVGTVILDLSDTSYLDSAGLRLILDLRLRLEHRRQRLRIVAPAETFVADVLNITAIEDSVPIDRSLADALEAAAGSGS